MRPPVIRKIKPIHVATEIKIILTIFLLINDYNQIVL